MRDIWHELFKYPLCKRTFMGFIFLRAQFIAGVSKKSRILELNAETV